MNYCDRKETVPLDLRGPRIPRPIAVVASSRAVVEFCVRFEGALADCGGVAATVYVSNGEGKARRIEQSYAQRGALGFEIAPDAFTEPGTFLWQLVVEAGGVSTEWARGQFIVLENPSADYIPIDWPDPPWLQKTDLPAYITAGDNVEISQDPVTKVLKISATGGGGSGISPVIAQALLDALNAARTTADIRAALVAFAESFVTPSAEVTQ